MEEIWKNIKGAASETHRYEISNLGKVKSIRHDNKIRYLKITIANKYETVHLIYGGRVHTKYIHRLIAEYFIPNYHNKPQVNHIDGNKSNNNISNLEWATAKENVIHSYKIGTSKTGEKRHAVVYSDEQVRQVKSRYEFGMRICDICRIMKFSKGGVYSMLKRKTYNVNIG